jgi:hypothetical protein
LACSWHTHLIFAALTVLLAIPTVLAAARCLGSAATCGFGGALGGTRTPSLLIRRGCQLMRVAEGRIAEVRGHYSDQHALDAFWKTE